MKASVEDSGAGGAFARLPGRIRAFMRRFGYGYWAFYCAAFCMDIGLGLYVFLFNLYLTDLHFDERLIGRILASFTLGNVAGTLPGMALARKYGLRPLLLVAFAALPMILVLRLFFLHQPEQVVLAFLSGAALCGWPICFAPVIAQLTSEETRATGFSLAFATGIGLGSFAGLAGGYIPQFLGSSGLHLDLVAGIRTVLLLACALVLLGLLPLSRLSLERPAIPEGKRTRIFHPYLLRFLPAFVLWNVVTGSFPIFGAVFLQKSLSIPLGKIGLVFAASQLTQFVAVLCSPKLFRSLGTARGIAVAQLCTAVFLSILSAARITPVAICFYLLYFGAQYMCGPGIYQMLMENVPMAERSSASAFQNLSGSLCQAGTAAITGSCIVAYGYRPVLIANAVIAILVSMLFGILGLRHKSAASDSQTSSEPRYNAPHADLSAGGITE